MSELHSDTNKIYTSDQVILRLHLHFYDSIEFSTSFSYFYFFCGIFIN